jgi:transcriptional regulator with XRE-family HTH domain
MVAAVSSGRLGGRVRALRRGRGLTLEELAGLSGVSRAMISKLERGEKNPTLVVAAKLAEGLGVTLSGLAGTEEERREILVVPRERRMVMRDPETGFVERGSLRAILGGEEYLLREGDALYFEADVTHRFDNAGEGECSYYLVISSRGT